MIARKSLFACFLAMTALQAACAQEVEQPADKVTESDNKIEIVQIEDDHDDHTGHDHAAPMTPLPTSIEDMPEFATTEAPDDHVVGSAEAENTLLVYASVTCPHCSSWFSNDWPVLKSELVDQGKLRFVFREIPTSPHQLAVLGFTVAECAPKDDYFSIIEHQMQNQSAIFDQLKAGADVQTVYADVMKMAGLETEEAIMDCLTDENNTTHIKQSSEYANGAQLSGVPAFYVNGLAYAGKQDAQSLISFLQSPPE